MRVGDRFSYLAAVAARRPLLTISLFGALAVGCAVAALGLRPTAATDTLVGRSSAAYQGTQSFYARFGEEPVEVLVKGDLRKLVLSSDIDRLVGLEGCLSGNVPAAALAQEGGPNGPCAQLARTRAVKVVFGPGTFINEAALNIDNALASSRSQAEREAKRAREVIRRAALSRGLGLQQANTLAQQGSKATMSGFAAEVSALAIRYGLSAPPSLDDHEFVSRLVFDDTKRAGTPKQRFAYLFPSPDSALVSVRLRAGLSESERSHAIDLIRRAVAMSQWRLQNGESYLVTGEPVIVSDLAGSISHSIELLLVAVLIVMGICLSLVFRSRPRLLPLGIALLAAALTFGALSLSGASLTMASVAVLPVLIGVTSGIGASSRWYRTIFLEEAGKDYVRTARAKGLSELRVMFRHVLKNAMIPILTGVVVVIPTLFLGNLLLESFFGIPGLGSFTIDAIQAQDFSIVRAMVFLGSVLYIGGLLLTDISYTLVDPRVRLS